MERFQISQGIPEDLDVQRPSQDKRERTFRGRVGRHSRPSQKTAGTYFYECQFPGGLGRQTEHQTIIEKDGSEVS